MGDMQFDGFGEYQPFEGFDDEESFKGFERRSTLNNEGGRRLEDEKADEADEGNDSEAIDKVSAKNNKVDASRFQEETINRTYVDRTDEKGKQKESKSNSCRPTKENGSSGGRSASKKKGTRLDPIETFPTYQEGLFAPPSEPRRKGSNMKFLLALQKPGQLKPPQKDLSKDKNSLRLKTLPHILPRFHISKRSHTYSSTHTNLTKGKTSNNDEKGLPSKKRKPLLLKSTELQNSAEKVEKSRKRPKIEKNMELTKKRDKIKPDISGSDKELDSVSKAMNLLDSDNEHEKSSYQTAESYCHSNDKPSFRVDEKEDKTAAPPNVPAVESHPNECLLGNLVHNMENNTFENQSIKAEPIDSLTPTPGIDLSTRKLQILPPNRQGPQTVQMNDPVLLVPFDHGFRRELVYRALGDSADVYYIPPVGKKLRSMRDIEIYLKSNNSPLAIYNFTFFRGLISSNTRVELARTAVPRGCRPNSRSLIASSMASSSFFEETSAVIPSRPPRTKSKVRTFGNKKKKRPAASAKKINSLKINLKKPPVSSLDICKEQDTLFPISLEVKEEGESHQEKRIPPLTIGKPIGETSWHRSENTETVNNYSLIEGAIVKSEIIDDSDQNQQTEVVEEISNYDQLVSSDSSVKKSLASNIDKSLAVDKQFTDTEAVPPSDNNQSVSISVRKSSDLYPSSPKERRKLKVPSRFLDSSPEPSSPSNVIDKQPVVQNTRKIVSPLVPCTVLCLKARGEYPQLPCSVCLCFYHKQCLGFSSNSVIDPSALVCPSCQNLSSSQPRSNNWQKSQSGNISSSRKCSYNSRGNRTELEVKSQKELEWDIVSESINMVAQNPDESPATKSQASSYAKGLKATSQESTTELLQLELAAVTQNPKELKDACVQTDEEHILTNATHPPPPTLPITVPILGSQTIEHIRDKQKRLRRFVVISNTPLSMERPCPFTPLPEPFDLAPESARVPSVAEETLVCIARIEESVEGGKLPKKEVTKTPAWRTDLMNSLNYTYKSLVYIFSFLTFAERGHAALVCKLWHTVANDPVLWRHIDTRKLKIRSLHNFFTRVRKLEIVSLDLRGIEIKQSDSLYKYLNIPDAKKVVICPCRSEVVEKLVQSCHNLVEIDASEILSTFLNLSELKNQHRLEKLVLQFSTDAEVSGLSDFKKLYKMKCLSLLGVVNIMDISYLEFMPRLETLSLGNLTSLIQESFYESLLRNVNHLKYLKLVEGPDWDINLSILRSFGSLEQLNVLEVLRFKIEQSIKDLFQLMPNLEKFLLMPVLTFDSMDVVLGDLLDHLSSLSNLKQFCLVLPDECILFDGTVVVRRETIDRLDALRARISVSSDVEMHEVSLIEGKKSVMTESRVEKTLHKPNTIVRTDVDIVDPNETRKESLPTVVDSDKIISHGSKLKQSAEITSVFSLAPCLLGCSPAQNHTEEHSGSGILDSVANSITLDMPHGTERDLDKEAEDYVPNLEIARIEGEIVKTEKELEFGKSHFRANVEMDLHLSDQVQSENESNDKVKFQIGSAESSSNVPYDAIRSVSSRESKSLFSGNIFNFKSVNSSLAKESDSAFKPQSINSSFYEPQDENAHLGPSTTLITHSENTMSSAQEQNRQYVLELSSDVGTSTSKDGAVENKFMADTADCLCTVTPEDLFDYFKLALPNVQICVVKVNDEALRTFRLGNLNWKDSSFTSLC